MDQHASIKARFELAKSRRQQVESDISEAYQFVDPMGDPLRTPNTSIDNQKINDNTAYDALNTLTGNIEKYLFPKDRQWARLVLSRTERERLNGATAQWDTRLETATEILFEQFNGSNLELATSEALKAVCIAGYGCIALELTDYGLSYRSIPTSELYFLDSGGCEGVDTVFRCVQLPARTVVEKYSKKGRVPTWITELASGEKVEEQVEIIEAMVPAKKRRSFEFKVYSGKGWEPILDQKVSFAPFVVFRWDKSTSDHYGNSPIRRALPDIRTLNYLVGDVLDDSQFAAKGAWTSEDESLRDQVLTAGRILFTQSELKPVQFPGQFSINVNMLQSMRNELRQTLMADTLPSGSNRMTTEEIQERRSAFFSRISPSANRLEAELLLPIVYHSVKALQAIGKIERFGIDDDPVRVETNAIVKRIYNHNERTEMGIAIQEIAQIAQVAKTLMNINVPKLVAILCERAGIPAAALLSEEEMEQAMAASQLATAVSGAVQTMRGQGTPEGAQAAGEGLAGIMSRMQQAA